MSQGSMSQGSMSQGSMSQGSMSPKAWRARLAVRGDGVA